MGFCRKTLTSTSLYDLIVNILLMFAETFIGLYTCMFINSKRMVNS